MKNPYIAGNWVRGEAFVGREDLLAEILDGPQQALWVAGTRRLGKTSLLRETEWRCRHAPWNDRYLPLFWDLQGAGDPDGLAESLRESLEDAAAEGRFAGLDLAELETQGAVDILKTVRRHARERERILLLLCDECEELITVGRKAPELLPRLRRLIQQGSGLRTVLCATRRLMALHDLEPGETSPFLHGLIPPLYLGMLDAAGCRMLIDRGGFDAADAATLMRLSGGHPYLLQLLCRRLFESRDLAAVEADLHADELVSRFFEVDFETLETPERRILHTVLLAGGLTPADLARRTAIESDRLNRDLQTLIALGFLKRDDETVRMANPIFERWLRREGERLFPGTASTEPASGDGEGRDEDAIGPYRRMELLGKGAMGRVWKAWDPRLERTVAIKLLARDMPGEEGVRERFYQEARAASRLNHPNIATVYDIGESGGHPYLVMEYVDGLTLDRWRREGHPDAEARMAVAVQIAAGLAAAHVGRVIHRDLKPENILVTGDGHVRITDFGLARVLDEGAARLTRPGDTMGTLAYMAPEQVSGGATDVRTDIFSLGVLLYELFTDRLPHDGANEAALVYAIVQAPPPDPRIAHPDMPVTLAALLLHCLEKSPADRYPDMAALLTDLGAV